MPNGLLASSSSARRALGLRRLFRGGVAMCTTELAYGSFGITDRSANEIVPRNRQKVRSGGRDRSRQLWRSTVTHMNNVIIVSAALRVTLSQGKGCFCKSIDKTRKTLFSISVSKQNEYLISTSHHLQYASNTQYNRRVVSNCSPRWERGKSGWQVQAIQG